MYCLTQRHLVERLTDEGYKTENHPGGSLTDVQRFINYIEEINPYVYFNYLTGKFKPFDVKYDEENRLRAIRDMSDGQGWITQLQQYCSDHNIRFDDVVQRAEDNSLQALQTYLGECAKSEARFIVSSAEQNNLIRRLQYWLSTDKIRISSFNQILQAKNLPFEIKSKRSRDNCGSYLTYWKIVRKDATSSTDEQE